MKALQCVELGGVDKLEINEVSSPDVGPGQVLINVKAGVELNKYVEQYNDKVRG